MLNKSNTLTGIVGEYYVAAELSKKGLFAAITLRNTEGYDILATNPESKEQFCIQVKTTWNRRKWVMGKKVENNYSKNHFYILVNLFEEDKRPEFFIIKSEELASIIKTGHANWLKTPGVNNQPHNDNNIREFRDNDGKYLEKWDVFFQSSNIENES